MKKNRGFTLIEILSVIVILGIITSVTIFSVNFFIERAKLKYYKTQENLIITAGKDYFTDYRSLLPKDVGEETSVDIETLYSKKYLDRVKDYSGKLCKINNDSINKVYAHMVSNEKIKYYVIFDCNGYKTKQNEEINDNKKVYDRITDDAGDNGKVDKTDPDQTFITGINPKNYVWYSGKMWRAVSIDTSDNSVKLVTQWTISAIPYNQSGNTAFKGSYIEQWLNDTTEDGFLGNLREAKKFIKTKSVWNATMVAGTSKPPKTTMVTDAVGLLNAYEYKMSYKNATPSTGYLNNRLLWWTLTPYNSSLVNIIATNVGNNNPTNMYGVRPAINLKPSVRVASGTGTADDPYRLQGDNDNSLSGVPLSTRYSGEYVSFGIGDNNLYRIVSHEEDDNTKITSSLPLRENGNYKNIAFGKNPNFASDNIVGSFLNDSYLNSETYLTNGQVNMIEDNTTWYLGRVGLGVNYKLAKYQNATSSTLTDKTVTAKVGLLRAGELLSGQIDKQENNNSYWLLTPYSMANVRNVGQDGYSNNFSPTNSYGIRPTMNLKSNVIITGGDGTKNNPFKLSLK